MDSRKEKTIIVGNSVCLFENNNDDLIDSYGSVVRINGGMPQVGNGRRTDIWSLSTMSRAMYEQWAKWFPDAAVWFLNRRCYESFIPPGSTMMREADYDTLINDYGYSRPSTGLITVYYASEILGLDVDIIGFDFFKRRTWYRDSEKHGPHKGEMEEGFIRELVGDVL